MIDLNKIVNDTLVEMEKENYVEKVVKSTLEKTIASLINDVFRSYGDFGKNLEKHIEENLNIDFRNLGIEGYNGLVLAAVQEQLDKAITIQGIDKIKESMNDMLKDTKDEYTLTEIIEKLKGESYKEEYEFGYDEKVELIIEDSDYGYKYIYMDEEEKGRKYECDYRIALDKEGKPYSIKLKGDEINTKKIMGGLYGLDKLLFKIYSSGAKIVLDQGECSEDYGYELYYTHED